MKEVDSGFPVNYYFKTILTAITYCFGYLGCHKFIRYFTTLIKKIYNSFFPGSIRTNYDLIPSVQQANYPSFY